MQLYGMSSQGRGLTDDESVGTVLTLNLFDDENVDSARQLVTDLTQGRDLVDRVADEVLKRLARAFTLTTRDHT